MALKTGMQHSPTSLAPDQNCNHAIKIAREEIELGKETKGWIAMQQSDDAYL